MRRWLGLSLVVYMRYSPATGKRTNKVPAIERMRMEKGFAQVERAKSRARVSQLLARGRKPREVVVPQETVIDLEGYEF